MSAPIPVSRGLPPVLPPARGARVLLLGSLPGAVSIARGQYYANPQNAFWRVMMDLTAGDADWPYARKIAHLKRARVALWDVLAQAARLGSLDSNIERESEKPNPVARVVAQNPGLTIVAANGQAAGALYRRHIRGGRFSSPIVLPSTSPANARYSFARKLALWRGALAPHLPRD